MQAEIDVESFLQIHVYSEARQIYKDNPAVCYYQIKLPEHALPGELYFNMEEIENAKIHITNLTHKEVIMGNNKPKIYDKS